MNREDWFGGGTNDGTYVSASGLFLVELNVPEGLPDQQCISLAHKATNIALARVTGTSTAPAATTSVWIQVIEWPEGHLAVAGNTGSPFGITPRAGHSADHPVLAFPRAYFTAKDRRYSVHGFPEQTSGRGLKRY